MIRSLCNAGVRVTGAWNWKAAILSAACRAPIFMLATAKYGWRVMSLAAIVELIFRFFFSGVFAGITQSARKARPVWRAFVCITVVVPMASMCLDGLVHGAMRTPNLKAGIGASLLFPSSQHCLTGTA